MDLNNNNNMVVLKVCFLLVFLVGITNARMDLSLLTGGHHSSDESSKPCCDSCVCAYSEPPQCYCADIRMNSCHSACKYCICTLSEPAMCRCVDTTDFCYKHCKSSDDDKE